MKKFNYVLIGAASMLLAGCAKEMAQTPVSEELVEMTLNVESPTVKAALDGFNIVWSKDDKITVAYLPSGKTSGKDSKALTFTYAGTPGSQVGGFVGTVPSGGTVKHAIFPATASYSATKTSSAWNPIAGKEQQMYSMDLFEVPSEQIAVKDGINGKYLISGGNISGNSVSLTNLVALIKVTIPADMTDIASVTLRTTSGFPLSGAISPAFTEATWFDASQQYPYVTLKAQSGVLEPGTYYIASVPFGNDRNRFYDKQNMKGTDIIFKNSAGKVARKTIKSEQTLDRNKVFTLNFPAGTELLWRDEVRLTLKMKDILDYLTGQGAAATASRLTQDVEFTLDTCKVILKGYTTETAPAGMKTPAFCGWYANSGKLGQANYITATSTASKDKVIDKLYIKIPSKYGNNYLRYCEFGCTAAQRTAAIVDAMPYDPETGLISNGSANTSQYAPVDANCGRLSVTRNKVLDDPEIYLIVNSQGTLSLEGDFEFIFQERLPQDGK